MKPYDIDIDELLDSKEIKRGKELLKYSLAAEFLKLISKMETAEVLDKTGLNKSDLSRIRAMSVARFSSDKISALIDALGYLVKIKTAQIKEAS
jgi:hypothetical protein